MVRREAKYVGVDLNPPLPLVILIFPIPNLQNHRIFFLGNYSCLAAKFNLFRSIGFHLVQSYIPTILFVIVSWVSFWMDVEHVPGRVALGVTTLLTISSKSAGLSSESPQVSYVKVRSDNEGGKLS